MAPLAKVWRSGRPKTPLFDEIDHPQWLRDKATGTVVEAAEGRRLLLRRRWWGIELHVYSPLWLRLVGNPDYHAGQGVGIYMHERTVRRAWPTVWLLMRRLRGVWPTARVVSHG